MDNGALHDCDSKVFNRDHNSVCTNDLKTFDRISTVMAPSVEKSRSCPL